MTILSPRQTRPAPSSIASRSMTTVGGWASCDAADQNPDDEWLQLVCWRAHGPRSLWKRPMDFPNDLVTFNEELPRRTDMEARNAWDDAVRQLREDGVLVRRHSFAPWKASLATERNEKPQSALSLANADGGLTPVSYPIASLREAWMHDIQVHAFAESDVQLTATEVIERLDQVAEEAYEDRRDSS